VDLGKLNFPMVVQFWAQANFQYCPSCLQKYCSIQKRSKLTKKLTSRFTKLNPPVTHSVVEQFFMKDDTILSKNLKTLTIGSQPFELQVLIDDIF